MEDHAAGHEEIGAESDDLLEQEIGSESDGCEQEIGSESDGCEQEIGSEPDGELDGCEQEDMDSVASDTRPAMIRRPSYDSPLPLLLVWIIEAGQELWRRKSAPIELEAPAFRMGELKMFLEWCGQAIFSDRSDTVDSMIIMHQVASVLPEVILALSNGTVDSEKMPGTDIEYVGRLARRFKRKYLDIKLTDPRPMEDKLVEFLEIPKHTYHSDRLERCLSLMHESMKSLDEIEALLKRLSDVKPYHVQVELDRLRVELVDLRLVFEIFNNRQAACEILKRR